MMSSMFRIQHNRLGIICNTYKELKKRIDKIKFDQNKFKTYELLSLTYDCGIPDGMVYDIINQCPQAKGLLLNEIKKHTEIKMAELKKEFSDTKDVVDEFYRIVG